VYMWNGRIMIMMMMMMIQILLQSQQLPGCYRWNTDLVWMVGRVVVSTTTTGIIIVGILRRAGEVGILETQRWLWWLMLLLMLL
jgi:hypothetical protein